MTGQLNTFYARFNRTEPQDDCVPSDPSHHPAPITVEERKVISMLAKVNPRNTPGPDGLKGHVLKESAAQLGGVMA
ncbi:hypothetical protein SKAU_G00005080 [Synaphobranchus kaupii]|uniref:Uncharacterized protein n=1 Tax=Synaphobranchus kaupii TaxID=118154 RepID=A0A9Q1G8Y7_SYNKA|nr:hypothetical protein SKAU_G00005080 [Synaphobranchus kaupii]